ncbi:MAG: hypothetical protein M3494_06610 [Actinomycetota bacterium]|jgi:hypothetical protein|nr:hypothetical protein [Rubrobacter sp.]MDQ3507670.1 hypothetical protein [Actinomycetota bacterium]
MKRGDRAPFFSLIAAGSGHQVSLRKTSGGTIVLILHGRGDEEAVREMNRAMREKFPEPDDPIVASVIDLSFVPPFYWVAANMELDRAYREAANALPPDADPREHVVILPDWTGSTTRKYRDSERDGVSAVVIGGDSSIVGAASGEGAAESVLDMLGD